MTAAPGSNGAIRDTLARLYDLDLVEDPGDLDLYLALAARAGGSVLELAAGTGRIAVPLAEAGHAVTAVDIDAAMLARLRRRAEAAGDAARRRLTIVEADLLDLDTGLPSSFAARVHRPELAVPACDPRRPARRRFGSWPTTSSPADLPSSMSGSRTQTTWPASTAG